MDNAREGENENPHNGGEIFHDAKDVEYIDCINMNGNGQTNPTLDDEADAFGRPGGRPGEVYAKMPVELFASHYKMDHKKRGLALIFNHEFFQSSSLKPRTGTNVDCDNLKDCLKWLGFEVLVYKDLNYHQLEDKVKQAAEADHSDHDCILIVVLSHGERGIVYAKDTPYKPDHIWSMFTGDRCPTLAGKPKMFFLQACQGDQVDGGVNMTVTTSTTGRTETDGEIHINYKIPSQADFLIVYSTVKGFFSWRNTMKGSWFVQALCDELRKLAHKHDLVTILTFVSLRVAVDFESNVPDSPSMHRQKQIPCLISRLTRLIKFNVPSGYGASGSSGSGASGRR